MRKPVSVERDHQNAEPIAFWLERRRYRVAAILESWTAMVTTPEGDRERRVWRVTVDYGRRPGEYLIELDHESGEWNLLEAGDE